MEFRTVMQHREILSQKQKLVREESEKDLSMLLTLPVATTTVTGKWQYPRIITLIKLCPIRKAF